MRFKFTVIIPNFAVKILQNLPRRSQPRKSRRDFRALVLRNSKEFLRTSSGQSFRLTRVEVSQKFARMFLCNPLRRKTCSIANFGIISVWFFLFFVIFNQKAYAYLDPGTGSYFFQLLIATVIGGLFAVKLYWRKISCFLKELFLKKRENGK